MPRGDDYGFWADERDRSRTGPIPRLSREPRGPIQNSVRMPLIPHPDDRQPNFALRRIAALVAVGVVAASAATLIGRSGHPVPVVSAADTRVGQQIVEPGAVVPADAAAPVTIAAPTVASAAATGTDAAPVAASASSTAAPAATSVTATTAAAVPTAATTVASAAPPAPIRAETEANVTATTASTLASTGSVAPTDAGGPTDTGGPAAVVDQSPVVDQSARVDHSCADRYDVVAGDYWILIADKVSVRLTEVLKANGANVDTPLYPGRTICLPANASAPTTDAPPTTEAPTTTQAPTTTETTTATVKTSTAKATTTTIKATTATSKTVAAVKATSTSTTKQAPSTTAAPPRNTYTRAQVEQIIRDVWPDDLEDEAIRIATRESNLIPTVRNSCCYGLFQMYWNVNRGWMASAGVTSSDQLYDPHVNAYLAFAMYLRSGGWGPWT